MLQAAKNNRFFPLTKIVIKNDGQPDAFSKGPSVELYTRRYYGYRGPRRSRRRSRPLFISSMQEATAASRLRCLASPTTLGPASAFG